MVKCSPTEGGKKEKKKLKTTVLVFREKWL